MAGVNEQAVLPQCVNMSDRIIRVGCVLPYYDASIHKQQLTALMFNKIIRYLK